MIRTFACRETEKIFNRQISKKLPKTIQKIARRKLIMIHRANGISDLQVVPGNQFEKLKGDRKGQYSIRVNNQWRICFRWSGGHADDVEIVDYH